MNQSNLNIKYFQETPCDCANYTGTVTVSSYLGDRLIQTQTKHNAGLPKLFSFIANCLEGAWTVAKDSRPCKLALLKSEDGEDFNKLNADGTANTNCSTPTTKPDYWSINYAVATPIMYDTAVVSTSNNLTSSITYHFRVPFLSLVGGSAIKKLMLLPAIASSYAQDACAYYVLNEPIEVPTASGNFTVIVDWTLTFTNQNGGN